MWCSWGSRLVLVWFVCCAVESRLGSLRVVGGEQVLCAPVGEEALVQGVVDNPVGKYVKPLAGRPVLGPDADTVATVRRPVCLGHVPAEPGVLAVFQVAAADALQEVPGLDEPSGFDGCGDEAAEGAVAEGAAGGGCGVEVVAAGSGASVHVVVPLVLRGFCIT